VSSLSESGEYSVKMIDQLLRCSREDGDIIQVTNTDVVERVVEDVFHEAAEGGRCVGQTEGHPRPLEQASSGTER